MMAWLLIVAVGSSLYALWLFLHTVFDGIDQWHAASRERRDAESANREKVRSDF